MSVAGGRARWAAARGLGWATPATGLDPCQSLLRGTPAQMQDLLSRPMGVFPARPSPLARQRGSDGRWWPAWCPGSLGVCWSPRTSPVSVALSLGWRGGRLDKHMFEFADSGLLPFSVWGKKKVPGKRVLVELKPALRLDAGPGCGLGWRLPGAWSAVSQGGSFRGPVCPFPWGSPLPPSSGGPSLS